MVEKIKKKKPILKKPSAEQKKKKLHLNMDFQEALDGFIKGEKKSLKKS